MKRLVLLACLLAAGCGGVPVNEKFPGVAPEFMVPPPQLKTIDTTKPVLASDVFNTVIDNYGTYNEQSAKLLGWQDWYIKQKAIFDQLNGASSK